MLRRGAWQPLPTLPLGVVEERPCFHSQAGTTPALAADYAAHVTFPIASPSSALPEPESRTQLQNPPSPLSWSERAAPTSRAAASDSSCRRGSRAHARPVCLYSRSSATRRLSSCSSVTSVLHMASPESTGADRLSDSRRASRMRAASA